MAPSRSQLPLPTILVLAAPALAAAQSFNIDIGDANANWGKGEPSASYGAAANMRGHWHHIDVGPMADKASHQAPPLVDVDGDLTFVTASFAVVNNGDILRPLSFDEGNTFGDDELLMDDGMYCIGEPFTITIEGLIPGPYDIYTYAMAPDNPSFFTQVEVPAGTGGVQSVGGAFPNNGHKLSVTYAQHGDTVHNGGTIVILISEAVGDDSVNGFQLVQASDPIGTNYCGPASLNSSGKSAKISAFGSDFVAANNLRLDAVDTALNQPSFFIASLTQGFVQPPGSQGFLCLGGTIARFNQNVINTGGTGEAHLQIDLNDIPIGGGVAVQPGETWNFQHWFRDNDPNPTSNLTDGISILFQ